MPIGKRIILMFLSFIEPWDSFGRVTGTKKKKRRKRLMTDS